MIRRLLIVGLLILLLSTPAAAEPARLSGTLLPSPTKVGRALITWEAAGNVTQWWLFACPVNGACAVIQSGTHPQHGTIELFAPRPGESYTLRGKSGTADLRADIGTIPPDWNQRWALLPLVQQ